MLLMASLMLLFLPAFALSLRFEGGPAVKVALVFTMGTYSGCVCVLELCPTSLHCTARHALSCLPDPKGVVNVCAFTSAALQKDVTHIVLARLPPEKHSRIPPLTLHFCQLVHSERLPQQGKAQRKAGAYVACFVPRFQRACLRTTKA